MITTRCLASISFQCYINMRLEKYGFLDTLEVEANGIRYLIAAASDLYITHNLGAFNV